MKTDDKHSFLAVYTEELCLKDFDKEIQWKHFCELADANFTWCYIDDLLPRRGGQEDD